MERERDGTRKTLALLSLVKALLVRKVDALAAMMVPATASSAAVDPEFETALHCLTSAAKVRRLRGGMKCTHQGVHTHLLALLFYTLVKRDGVAIDGLPHECRKGEGAEPGR